MRLRTGVEMISLSVILNKVAGFYGLLAILTGFELNPMQLSMYIYSVAALILIAFLIPHIRKQTPMQCLALAWFYTLDSIINCIYTIVFAFTWFLSVNSQNPSSSLSGPLGDKAIDSTAGFASPRYISDKVDVVVPLASGLTGRQDAAAIGTDAVSAAIAVSPVIIQHGFELAESITSLTIIVLLTLIRLYFILIMMAYARQVLRLNMHATKSNAVHLHIDGSSDLNTDNSFGYNTSSGQGWRGRLGRVMIYLCKDYFLGEPVQNDWTKDMNDRFKTSTKILKSRDTFERERRARNGAGPSEPHIEAIKSEMA